MMLLDLADAARKSGLEVVEVRGWQTRGHGALVAVNGVVLHHTGTPMSAPGDYPTMRTVVEGRPDLEGPLANLGLGRDGTVYVIAAGRAYHAGVTFLWRQDNYHTIGIEAEHPGGDEPWTPVQYHAYVRLVLALKEHYGLPLSNVEGHKEVAKPLGRKVDPNFDMTAFRRAVWKLRRQTQLRAKLETARARVARIRAKLAAL